MSNTITLSVVVRAKLVHHKDYTFMLDFKYENDGLHSAVHRWSDIHPIVSGKEFFRIGASNINHVIGEVFLLEFGFHKWAYARFTKEGEEYFLELFDLV